MFSFRWIQTNRSRRLDNQIEDWNGRAIRPGKTCQPKFNFTRLPTVQNNVQSGRPRKQVHIRIKKGAKP